MIKKGGKKTGSLWLVSILITLAFSCSDNLIKSEYQATENGYWHKDSSVEFSFSEIDTVDRYNMFIAVRNDNTFRYNNLFLIAELEFPNGETVKDTLEYQMALPDGTWLGKGYGSIKENKLWYKENIVFPTSGVYKLKLEHAMRKNGSINGVENLQGITDVGFEIEKSN